MVSSVIVDQRISISDNIDTQSTPYYRLDSLSENVNIRQLDDRWRGESLEISELDAVRVEIVNEHYFNYPLRFSFFYIL